MNWHFFYAGYKWEVSKCGAFIRMGGAGGWMMATMFKPEIQALAKACHVASS